MNKFLKIVKANLGRSSALGGAAPKDIEFLPAGVHENVQFSNLDELKKLGFDMSVIIVDEDTAKELESQLQAILEKVKAGEASRPFIDFDHDGKRAAG